MSCRDPQSGARMHPSEISYIKQCANNDEEKNTNMGNILLSYTVHVIFYNNINVKLPAYTRLMCTIILYAEVEVTEN